MRKAILFSFIFIVAMLLLTSCQKKNDEFKDAQVVAKIDDFEITYKDLSDQFQKIYPQQFLTKATQQVKQDIIDDMIKQHIILREAYRLGYDKNNEVIKLAEKKERILAGSALEKREAYDKVINEDAIRQFYQLSDRELHVWRMLFRFGDDDARKEEKRKKAEDLYQKLQQGTDFKALAARYSEHVNAEKDSGNLHVVGCFDIDEEIFKQAYQLSEGEISRPFIANYAYYLLMVEKIYPKKLDDFAKERPGIVEKLESYYKNKLSRQYHEFRKSLLNEFHYTLSPENIEFFCKRAGTMKTRQDSTELFNEKDKAIALCKTDVNEITIGSFFDKAFQHYWNSLNQKRLVEMLLINDCYEELKKHKGMSEHLNELPDIKDKYNEWLAGFLKSYVIEKEVIDKIDVSDSVLKSIYVTRKNSLIFKERRTVREIFQKTEDGIKKVHLLAVKGNDFEGLEKKYQQSMETRTNGILGPFTKGPHGKLGENAFSMKVGEISEPFKYRGGYSIIKLLSIELERTKSFDEAKEELKNEYLDSNQEQFISQWYEKIKENYSIKINRF